MNYYANDYRSNKYTYFFWAGLLAIMLVRTFYFGLTYFHFLGGSNYDKHQRKKLI